MFSDRVVIFAQQGGQHSIHWQWIQVIHPRDIAVHIPNIIPISSWISLRGYSARHPTSQHHNSTTQDVKSQDIEISTHNSHRDVMSQRLEHWFRISTHKLQHMLKLHCQHTTHIGTSRVNVWTLTQNLNTQGATYAQVALPTQWDGKWYLLHYTLWLTNVQNSYHLSC